MFLLLLMLGCSNTRTEGAFELALDRETGRIDITNRDNGDTLSGLQIQGGTGASRRPSAAPTPTSATDARALPPKTARSMVRPKSHGPSAANTRGPLTTAPPRARRWRRPAAPARRR